MQPGTTLTACRRDKWGNFTALKSLQTVPARPYGTDKVRGLEIEGDAKWTVNMQRRVQRDCSGRILNSSTFLLGGLH